MSTLTDKRKKESLKLRTEVKAYVDSMLVNGIKITKADVMKSMNVSNGFVNSSEISDYIKAAIKKQEKVDLRIDVDLQNTILYRKLMSSYIFQFALLDEQEALLKYNIEEMKKKLDELEKVKDKY